MENQPRANIRTLIVDPETFLPSLTEQKVRMLLVELDMLTEDFDRETAIMYLASNYSNNKHLSFTALRGMHDSDIKEYMVLTRAKIMDELKSRKKN